MSEWDDPPEGWDDPFVDGWDDDPLDGDCGCVTGSPYNCERFITPAEVVPGVERLTFCLLRVPRRLVG